MKRSAIEGHRTVLWIARNLELILGLISFYLGVILIKWSAPQPTAQADTPTYQKDHPPKNDINPKIHSLFPVIRNSFLCPSIVLLFVGRSCCMFSIVMFCWVNCGIKSILIPFATAIWSLAITGLVKFQVGSPLLVLLQIWSVKACQQIIDYLVF